MEYWLFSNESKKALNYIKAGITHLVVDIEVNQKAERQQGRNTLISNHKLEDILLLKDIIFKENIICRINPMHEKSKYEINTAINYGASALILPYFQTIDQLKKFLEIVDKRVRTIALVETINSFMLLPEITLMESLDHIHIGLNDLSIELGNGDMFEIVKNGWMEIINDNIISNSNINFGFGGISNISDKNAKYCPEKILLHHLLADSKSMIISRTFIRNCELISKNNNEKFWQVFGNQLSKLDSYFA